MTMERQQRFSQDVTFQRREWRVQRIGWVLLTLFIAAALAGLLGGSGPLVKASARAPDGTLAVEYDRFVRQEAETALEVQSRFASSTSDELRVWILRPYLDAVTITSITPEPERVVLDEPRTTFVFRVSPGKSTSVVRFELHVRRVGRLSSSMGLVGAGSVEFTQLSYF
ncbi:MAG: hypothetical protein ACRD2X_22010 [Vicinamibacteraceae bacterium]